MKHLILFGFFYFAFFYCPAQLAKLTNSGEQQYRMNYSRGAYLNVMMKAIRTNNIEGLVPDKDGGYIKYAAIKADHGTSKEGTYVHFAKLDKKLLIQSEKDEILSGEGSENIYPVASFVNGTSFYIIQAGPGNSKDHLSLVYCQFNLSTLVLEKSNIRIATLPFEKDKSFEFRSLVLGEKTLVINILEEGGKKEPSRLHCLRFDKYLSPLAKQTTELPYTGKKGSILQTKVNSNGTVFCLLGYLQKMGDEASLNSLAVFSDKESRHVPITHGDEVMTNCVLGLTSTGQILLSGMLWPGQKDAFPGFVVSSVNDAGKMQVVQEESFSQSLLGQLENASRKGLELDYAVRSVSQRANGVLDVVINYCRMGGYVSGSGYAGGNSYGSTTRISDAVIFSFANGKLVSTLPLKRNLRHGNDYNGYYLSEQTFSIPAVFNRNDDLYLVYFDNPDNSLGTGGQKPNWSDFSKGSLVLAKLDKNHKPRQQTLMQFEKSGDFRLFYDLRTYEIDEGKFVLLNDRPVLLSKNVKTAAVLVSVAD